MIELKNISKEYIDEFGFKIDLLKDISFTIPPGKITTVIAPAGAGKSSLLKIIAGLEEKTSGDLVKDGNGFIAYLPSNPGSFPWLNVRNNILFGMHDYNISVADQLAKLVGLKNGED